MHVYACGGKRGGVKSESGVCGGTNLSWEDTEMDMIKEGMWSREVGKSRNCFFLLHLTLMSCLFFISIRQFIVRFPSNHNFVISLYLTQFPLHHYTCT